MLVISYDRDSICTATALHNLLTSGYRHSRQAFQCFVVKYVSYSYLVTEVSNPFHFSLPPHAIKKNNKAVIIPRVRYTPPQAKSLSTRVQAGSPLLRPKESLLVGDGG